MNRTIKLVFAAACLAAGAAVAETPTAIVREITARRITVDGSPVTLDTAYGFIAWEGEKPDCDENYRDWIADFEVSFDREVKEGAVGLFGEMPAMPGLGWQSFPLQTVEDGERVRLLDSMGFSMTYGDVYDTVVRFNCGARAAKPEAYGTTMTVELRLYNPDNAEESVVCGRFSHRFVKPFVPNWFDANISQYVQWPEDAALARGGAWQSDEGALGDVAALETFGVLSVFAKKLSFFAERPRVLGKPFARVVFSGEINFGVNELDALPKVDPAWKGGVICVAEGEGAAYYGLAKDGEANVWKRLEGPAPTGGTVGFTATLRCRSGMSFVNYTINGTVYTLNGSADIPIVVSGEVKGLSFGGVGTISSLYGETGSGLMILMR